MDFYSGCGDVRRLDDATLAQLSGVALHGHSATSSSSPFSASHECVW